MWMTRGMTSFGGIFEVRCVSWKMKKNLTVLINLKIKFFVFSFFLIFFQFSQTNIKKIKKYYEKNIFCKI
jgi:hypothetical protein